MDRQRLTRKVSVLGGIILILLAVATWPLDPLAATPLAPDTSVTSVLPAPNSHTAPGSTNLTVNLSGAVQQGSVDTDTFWVHGGYGGHASGSFSFGSGSTQITFDPASDFHVGEWVQTSVTTDVLDSGAIPLEKPYVWQFRTAAGGTGQGYFGPSPYDTFGSGNSKDVALGDVDGDGDLDAVVAQYGTYDEVWLNDGSGGFGTTAHDAFGTGPSFKVALGDVDGDGDLDAVFAKFEEADEVWLNDGSGDFGTTAHDTLPGDATYPSTSLAVALGDVDGDGDLDAVFANDFHQAQDCWLNDGSGDFGSSPHDRFGGEYTFDVALGDMDGDGDLDAVITNRSDAIDQSEVWLNDGSGDFGTSEAETFGSHMHCLDLGDVDGDGDLDVAVGNMDFVNVYVNDGSGQLSYLDGIGYGCYEGTGRDVAFGDLDADGDLDIVTSAACATGLSQVVWLYEGNPDYYKRRLEDYGFGDGDSLAIAAGDMDGDGDLDIVTARDSQTQEVWLNRLSTDAPYVVSTSPGSGEGGVGPATPIVITFSEPINPATFTYTVTPDPGGWTETWNGDNTQVTLGHNPFAEGTQYTFTITGAQDPQGNDFEGPYTWSFATTDSAGPQVEDVSPAHRSAGVGQTAPLVVTFSEPIKDGTLAFTVTPDPGGWSESWNGEKTVVTLTHAPFAQDTQYAARINAADDLADNPLASPFEWTFSTGKYLCCLPLVMRNHGGGGIRNGDFEAGQQDWDEYSSHGWDVIMNSGFTLTPHSGSWLAWLGGGDNEIAYIEQDVTVPATQPYLTYWHWIISNDVCGWDYAYVVVDGSTVEQYDLCNSEDTEGWVLHQVNLGAYGGQTVTLQLWATTDDSELPSPSSLFIDDVSFEASLRTQEAAKKR